MITAPFGSWKSPITSDLIVCKTIGLGGVVADGDDIYWLEIRPNEKGRNVLVKYNPNGEAIEITPQPFNVRSRVHEYGGGAFLVSAGTIYFSNFIDGRIYRQTAETPPQPLTPEGKTRYTDIIIDRSHNRLICVCEDHSQPDIEAKNSIVTINLATGTVDNFISGADFYSSPCLSSDGSYLAWLSWHHPYMPWDSTYLWLAKVNRDGSLGEAKLVAGGENESICEPKWSSDGKLYFSSDRNDWWNLYRHNQDGTIESLYEMEAEFAYPHWVFGLSTYTFLASDKIVCTYSQNGSWHLGSIETQTKQFQKIETPYTNISSLQATKNSEALFIAGSPTEPTAVIKLDLATGKQEILKQSGK